MNCLFFLLNLKFNLIRLKFYFFPLSSSSFKRKDTAIVDLRLYDKTLRSLDANTHNAFFVNYLDIEILAFLYLELDTII